MTLLWGLRTHSTIEVPPSGGYSPPAGVAVTPATLVGQMAAQPPYTIFNLQDGTYNVTNLQPKTGQQFWANTLYGVIFDGGDTYESACWWPNVDYVQWHGIVVKNYVGSVAGEYAAFGWGAHQYGDSSQYWTLKDMIFEYNGYGGCRFGRNTVMDRVIMRYNGEVGLASLYPDGSTLNALTIHNNGILAGVDDWKTATGRPGGMKVLRPTFPPTGPSFTITNSVSYDNVGPGWWTDYLNNCGVVYDNCEAYGNRGPNWFIEGSRPGPYIVRNSISGPNQQWFGIYVSGSDYAIIEDNTITGRGIVFSEDNTGERACQDGIARNNTCQILESSTQGAQSQSGRNIFDVNRIEFEGNTYAGSVSTPFKWSGSTIGLTAWQALPQQ